MPAAQAMVERMNRRFNREGILGLDAQAFGAEADLLDLARRYEISTNPVEEQILAGIPSGIREMLRALIQHNLSREPRLAMQFAWAPGYDFELDVWEAPGTSVSPGGITVLIRTRYPLDAHPSTIATESAS